LDNYDSSYYNIFLHVCGEIKMENLIIILIIVGTFLGHYSEAKKLLDKEE
jgi:hypothetical protein